MIAATQIKAGMVIVHDGKPCRVSNVLHVTPGNWRGMVHAKMVNIITGSQVEHRFRSEDKVERADLEHHPLQYLYRSGDEFTFMNTGNYEQVHLSQEVLGDSALYLLPESLINVEFYETEPVGIHLPLTVDLTVKDTVPGIKGATAAAQVKPATLETGLVVTVPSFVNPGDKVRINTETGEYLSRA